MRQATLQLPNGPGLTAPGDAESTDLLVRLWDQTERSIALPPKPNPVPPQRRLAVVTAKVRYAYD